jgi:TPR repeat protein
MRTMLTPLLLLLHLTHGALPPAPPPPSPDLIARVRAEARRGSPAHLYALGLYQHYGAPGLPRDAPAALASFRAASDAGHGPGALALGLLLEARGEAGAALAHLLRAGEAGEAEGLHRAAALLLEGRAPAPLPPSGAPPLQPRALAAQLLARCEAAGYGPAFATLGLLHEYGGGSGGGADFGAAEAAYRRGCEGGAGAGAGAAGAHGSVGTAPDAEACYLWGLMLAYGRASRTDFGAAAALFHKAVALRGEAGHGPASLLLGKMRASGQGAPVDYDAALAHFAAARDGGDARVEEEAAREYAELDALVAEARAGVEATLAELREGMRAPADLEL